MKYIMFERKMSNTLIENIPIIFSKTLVHADVAEAISTMMKDKYDVDLTPVSAGEIYLDVKSVGDRSDTLQLFANPNDRQTIQMIDYLPFKQ